MIPATPFPAAELPFHAAGSQTSIRMSESARRDVATRQNAGRSPQQPLRVARGDQPLVGGQHLGGICCGVDQPRAPYTISRCRSPTMIWMVSSFAIPAAV